MKYQLIGKINKSYNAIQQVLVNRGIPFDEIHDYLNTTEKDLNDPKLLGEDLLKRAAAALIEAVSQGKKVLVLVDCDCDGYTSAAILINYLYDLFPAWVKTNLKWFLHEDKTHGLQDTMEYIEYFDPALIVIPDASSNDYKYHKQLKEEGRTIIILDHHEAEKYPEDTICINNQLSDYPNKELSGAGVTWQFCRYLDQITQKNLANKYIDLAALGNCGDMMSLKSLETKYIINEGFKRDNIKNPFIHGMSTKNSFSLGGRVTPMGAAFYIVPFINSMVRSGTLEEKELLFKSMLTLTAFEQILSNKRGHTFKEMESLLDQALRTATNVKNRQTREQDKGLELIESQIESLKLMKNKILLFLLKEGDVSKNIAGLIANKIMAKYQRPTCILFANHDQTMYQGSARGYERSGVTDFKDICSATGVVEYAEGHQNAFGLGIKTENIEAFIEKTNEALKDMQSEPIYYVDYIFSNVDVSGDKILEIAALDDLWGKDIDESLIAIEGLKVNSKIITLMSPDKRPSLKITLPNKVSLIKFGSSQQEYESLLSEGYVEINVVGRSNANEWNGYTTPQILITDYEIVGQSKYNF